MPCFNKSNAKEVVRWGRDPTLVQGMFYAFIFQDVIWFGITDEDARISLNDAIKNHEWGEFEAWPDTHRDLLIQRHKIEAPNSSVGSMSALLQRETPPGGKNDGEETSLSASSPILY